MNPQAQAEMDRFIATGMLPPGEWFVSTIRGAPLPLRARGGGWSNPICGEGSSWRPVGGPPVGAVGGWVDEFGRQRKPVLTFESEAHPFGRWNLMAVSIAYQASDLGLRVWMPAPAPLDRTSIALLEPVDPRSRCCEAYIPEVLI
jgi:hypothetical protein